MKLLVVFLAALVLVSAAPADRKKDKGDKGGKQKPEKPEKPSGNDGPDFSQIVRFCAGVTNGKLTNNDTSLDTAFSNVNNTCVDLLNLLRDCGEDVEDEDDGPDTNVSFNNISTTYLNHLYTPMEAKFVLRFILLFLLW